MRDEEQFSLVEVEFQVMPGHPQLVAGRCYTNNHKLDAFWHMNKSLAYGSPSKMCVFICEWWGSGYVCLWRYHYMWLWRLILGPQTLAQMVQVRAASGV